MPDMPGLPIWFVPEFSQPAIHSELAGVSKTATKNDWGPIESRADGLVYE